MWGKATHEKVMNEILPKLEAEVYALNDDFACHPELGSAEFETSKKIVALLRAHGIEVIYPFAGMETAFKATINPGQPKKAALLAEYDALPEIGHACGHCASGMASVMAILAAAEVQDELGDVQIDIIGTPDEEGRGGKVLMQQQGVFDGYDFAAMVHMFGKSKADLQFFALDEMEFKFKGKPAHAAACPEVGRNALNALRLLFDSADMMRQHVTQEAIISGYVAEGGKAANVVPDETRAVFITRASRRVLLDDITSWLKDCGRAAAMATRTEVEIKHTGESYDAYTSGPEKKSLVADCFRTLGVPVDLTEDKRCGSSDIGNVATACLTFHPTMSVGDGLEAHTREFAEVMTKPVTHQAILNSAKLLLEITYRLFSDEELLARLKKEHFEVI